MFISIAKQSILIVKGCLIEIVFTQYFFILIYIVNFLFLLFLIAKNINIMFYQTIQTVQFITTSMIIFHPFIIVQTTE